MGVETRVGEGRRSRRTTVWFRLLGLYHAMRRAPLRRFDVDEAIIRAFLRFNEAPRHEEDGREDVARSRASLGGVSQHETAGSRSVPHRGIFGNIEFRLRRRFGIFRNIFFGPEPRPGIFGNIISWGFVWDRIFRNIDLGAEDGDGSR